MLSACQSTPSNDSVKQTPETPAISITNSDIGQPFSWGGEILETRNLTDSTELTIISYPLDKHNNPDYDETSLGRFIAAYPGFLEPTDYRKGRLIFVSGKLKEIRSGKVASADYNYPVLSVDEINLQKRKPKGLNLPFSIGIGIGIHN